MLRHLVVIRFRADANEDAKRDAIEKLWLLRDHPRAINWTAGWNVFSEPKHDYALSCEFASQDDMREYLGSEAHGVAARALIPVMERDAFSYVDYEVSDAPVFAPAD
jgi:hypothetical protein